MSTSWWDRKLNDPEHKPAPAAPLPPLPMSPGRNVLIPPVPKATTTCPECRSENYLTSRTPHRCFDCGYIDSNRDLRNSTQGMRGTGTSSGATRQAPTEGFQPGRIIGHI